MNESTKSCRKISTLKFLILFSSCTEAILFVCVCACVWVCVCVSKQAWKMSVTTPAVGPETTAAKMDRTATSRPLGSTPTQCRFHDPGYLIIKGDSNKTEINKSTTTAELLHRGRENKQRSEGRLATEREKTQQKQTATGATLRHMTAALLSASLHPVVANMQH